MPRTRSQARKEDEDDVVELVPPPPAAAAAAVAAAPPPPIVVKKENLDRTPLRQLIEGIDDDGSARYSILRYLDVSDLGRMACVCSDWNSSLARPGQENQLLWKNLLASKNLLCPNLPSFVTKNYRNHYRSLVMRKTPDPYKQQQDDGTEDGTEEEYEEEYYIIVEFLHLHEFTTTTTTTTSTTTTTTTTTMTKPIIRCFKLDEEIWDIRLKRLGLRISKRHRLPINVETAPFNLEEFNPIFKLSILRSSDCKMALILDPDSDAFFGKWEKGIGSFFEECWQYLRFLQDGDEDVDEEPTASLSVYSDIIFKKMNESLELPRYSSKRYLKCFPNDAGYGVHVTTVFVHFDVGRALRFSEFLREAGVEWY